MAFERVALVPRSRNLRRDAADAVYVCVYVSSSKGVHMPRIAAHIGVNVLARIGAEPDSRVDVFAGTGVDFGFIQLVPSANGYVLAPNTLRFKHSPAKKPRYSTVLIPAAAIGSIRPADQLRSRPSERVTFQTFGSALTICLPSDILREKEGA
jgi:hypothetical protein